MYKKNTIATVIPCYKVSNQIDHVIKNIPKYVDHIVVVDDCCPEKSYKHINKKNKYSKLVILKHKKNMGVGAATKTGFNYCLEKKIDIVVKIDGDDQMDTTLMSNFLDPIIDEGFVYTKGNRFYYLESINGMPIVRILGNSFLSFFTKLSSGYWNIFDPTNGYIALKTISIPFLSLEKINNRYFFESDMLFRLYLCNSKIKDIPINSIYQNEVSNLSPFKVLIPFLLLNLKNFFKRIFYVYFLRDINIATIELIFGMPILIFGIYYGLSSWIESSLSGVAASTGTIVLSALAIIIGFQLLLGFLSYDINNNPNKG